MIALEIIEDIINNIKHHLHKNPPSPGGAMHQDFLDAYSKEKLGNLNEKRETNGKNSSESKYKQRSSFYLQDLRGL